MHPATTADVQQDSSDFKQIAGRNSAGWHTWWHAVMLFQECCEQRRESTPLKQYGLACVNFALSAPLGTACIFLVLLLPCLHQAVVALVIGTL